MASSDPFDLERFVTAQRGVYELALAEISAGCKRSHWMWFIFPQIAGLGTSAMSRRYAISGMTEARAYLDHPVLGQRLRECVTALNALDGLAVEAVFGSVDATKLNSCLTLFELAGRTDDPFAACLQLYYDSERDEATLRLLGGIE